MTAVKPKKNHPWNASIEKDVEEVMIRKKISELEQHIKVLNTEIKMNKKRLKELMERNLDGR
jgi:regulator of replication initiation timing